MAQTASLQGIVKTFSVDTMSHLRKIISDQLAQQAKIGIDSRALLELAADLQPFRRQINMPLFKKTTNQVGNSNHLLVPGSTASEDYDYISVSQTSSQSSVRKQMWQPARTVSANNVKHRLVALTSSQSALNSCIDNGLVSCARG